MRAKHLAVAGVMVLATISLFAPSAGAQTPVSTSTGPFHPGQWGIEAYAAGQSGGVLRFFTPRTALVFTLSADRLSTSQDDGAFGPTSNKGTVADIELGLRRHSMVAQHIAATLGGGLLVGSIQQKITYPAPQGTDSYHSAHFGAYVDVGGQYMIADHFAVGLAYRIAGQHVKSGPSGQAGSEFAMSFLPVRATLYF